MRNPNSIQYYLIRKRILLKMYDEPNLTPTKYFGGELLPCSLAVISGKIKRIDKLHTCFQIHNNKTWGWNNISMYDIICDPEFSKTISVIKRKIIEELIKQDNINKNEAKVIVDKELWYQIGGFTKTQYENKFPKIKNTVKNNNKIILSKSFKFKYLIRNIPGIIKPISILGLIEYLIKFLNNFGILLNKNIRINNNDHNNIFTVKNLLMKTSRYQIDFKEIYTILNNQDIVIDSEVIK